MAIKGRAYDPETDLPHLLALTQFSSQLTPEATYLHMGDILWRFFQSSLFDPLKYVRLWEESDGDVVAFAWLEAPDGVVWCVHPQYRGQGMLEEAIVAWAADLVEPEVPTAEVRLWTTACATDAATLQVLPGLGFLSDQRLARKMEFSLLHALADPPQPAGITLRAVESSVEWAQRVDLHRRVWHPSRVTLAAYKRLRAAPGYRPDLDLVAVTSEGEFAAYCLCWLDPVTHVGLFEPVGTHPAYRRQGVGTAVVREGLRRLQALGATTAWVTAVESNLAARKLYERVGFKTITYEYLYKRFPPTPPHF